MILTDPRHRVELRHFGVAHTRGDGFAWLPEERILFTGDACVNGPYNYMGEGHSGDWISTLEIARALKPKVVCPGHGRLGGPEVLDQQIDYLKSLRAEVKQLVDARKSATEVKASVESIRTTLSQKPHIRHYLGNMFASQVEKVFVEMGGKPFESAKFPAGESPQPFVPADDREVVWSRPSPRH